MLFNASFCNTGKMLRLTKIVVTLCSEHRFLLSSHEVEEILLQINPQNIIMDGSVDTKMLPITTLCRFLRRPVSYKFDVSIKRKDLMSLAKPNNNNSGFLYSYCVCQT